METTETLKNTKISKTTVRASVRSASKTISSAAELETELELSIVKYRVQQVLTGSERFSLQGGNRNAFDRDERC